MWPWPMSSGPSNTLPPNETIFLALAAASVTATYDSQLGGAPIFLASSPRSVMPPICLSPSAARL